MVVLPARHHRRRSTPLGNYVIRARLTERRSAAESRGPAVAARRRAGANDGDRCRCSTRSRRRPCAGSDRSRRASANAPRRSRSTPAGAPRTPAASPASCRPARTPTTRTRAARGSGTTPPARSRRSSTDRPMIAKIHVSEKREQQHDGDAGEQRRARPVCTRQADEIADDDHQAASTNTLRTRSASVRPDEHRRARHRQRSEPLDQALVQVFGEADAGLDRAEHDRLREHAGHQVVDVRATPGTLDRAAEHVAEHQHEDDRLDRREHEQLRECAASSTRLRHATVFVSAIAQPNGCAAGGRHGAGASVVAVMRHLGCGGGRPSAARPRLRAPRPVAGEREEHVVERRLAHRERRRLELLRRRARARRRSRRRAPSSTLSSTSCAVGLDVARAERARARRRARSRGRRRRRTRPRRSSRRAAP